MKTIVVVRDGICDEVYGEGEVLVLDFDSDNLEEPVVFKELKAESVEEASDDVLDALQDYAVK